VSSASQAIGATDTAPGSPPPIIAARGLIKRFGDHVAVDGIDLGVAAGLCFGLLGPNGAGKTTTLRMILGQSPPTAGTLRVFDQPIPEATRRVRARIGVVPQLDNLDPDFTVAENLRVYASYFGLGAEDVGERMDRLLAFAGLGERRDTRIEQLSGGMKRRLTIARALVNDPELLILDEPTTGLDPQARHLIWSRLRELRRAGKTLLLTTHFMEEAERLCDELVIMDAGRILSQGSPRALIHRHVEAHVVEVPRAASEFRSRLDGLDGYRLEALGDTTYLYADDARPLLHRLEDAPGLTCLHRPANLEDVFLRLTGHELRD